MNGCIYRTENGRCQLYSVETVVSFCPDELCEEARPSRVDVIRTSDEETAAKLLLEAAERCRDCEDGSRCVPCMLGWLREEADPRLSI